MAQRLSKSFYRDRGKREKTSKSSNIIPKIVKYSPSLDQVNEYGMAKLSSKRKFELLTIIDEPIIIKFDDNSFVSIRGSFIYDPKLGRSFFIEDFEVTPEYKRKKGIGRKSLKFFRGKLSKQYKLFAILVQLEAKDFWEKMKNEGLINGWFGKEEPLF